MKPIPLTETQMAELFRIRVENETLRTRLAELEKQDPVAFANQDDLDNMLDDRTAIISGIRDGFRKSKLYAAPVVSPDVEKLIAEISELKSHNKRIMDMYVQYSDENQSLKTELVNWKSRCEQRVADIQLQAKRVVDLEATMRSLNAELVAVLKDAEWISVDDRLPERYTEVMVWPHPSEQAMTAQFGLIRKKSAPMWHYSEYISGFGWEEQECNPTHWKPLPEPPAVEQAKGGV